MSKSKYSILIICEGKNTEPHFFNSIRDEIINKKYDIGNCSIRIRPEPSIEEEEEIKVSPNKPNFKSRTTKKAINGEEPEDIKGVPPLKWVEAGKEELRNGTFNEVWAVFDHDNHPAREAAFNAAEEQINGSSVNIAFSSRSFEYYLLLHFEKIYFTFIETECNTGGKNPKSLVCSTGVHTDDCFGKTCINGYARLKGYWDNSKKNQSIFPLIKDKLELGFINSKWLRLESDKNEGGLKKHDRNPYITTDSLVKRLIGDTFVWKWLFINNSININDLNINLLKVGSKNSFLEI
ncbi:MAG: RloB family protein [Bacteroidota bacterium]